MTYQRFAQTAIENLAPMINRLGIGYTEVTAVHGSTINIFVTRINGCNKYQFGCGRHEFVTVNLFEAIGALSNALEVA